MWKLQMKPELLYSNLLEQIENLCKSSRISAILSLIVESYFVMLCVTKSTHKSPPLINNQVRSYGGLLK